MISSEKLKAACWHYLNEIEDLFPSGIGFDVQPINPEKAADLTNGFGRIVISGPLYDLLLGRFTNNNRGKPILQFSCWAIDSANAGFLAERVLQAYDPLIVSLFPSMVGQCLGYAKPKNYFGPRYFPKSNLYVASCDIEFYVKLVLDACIS